MGRASTVAIIVLLALTLALNLVNYYSNQAFQNQIAQLQAQYSEAESRLQSLSETLANLKAQTPVTTTATVTETVTVTVKPEGELTPQEVFKRAEGSVVQIIVSKLTPLGITGGEGSGFVYSREGYIVTNNHVVEDARYIEVRFVDGSSYEGEIVGVDPYSDLAVVKVNAPPSKLKPLPLGDSSKLRVGDTVLAIGNPFGLKATMTMGIVSQLGRLLDAPGGYSIVDVIQVDAAINPGNSGGPLLNLKGEVVGVNTAIVSPTGAFAGIGFAISSNMVKQVVPDLIAKGYHPHPWVGIVSMELTPALAKKLKLPVERGLLVTEVVKGGPADKAGIRPGYKTVLVGGREIKVGGDIIVGVDDVEVKGVADLLLYLEYHVEIGQTVVFHVVRDGETVDVPVVIGERPPP